MKRDRRRTDLNIGMKQAGASLCKVFLLAEEGLLALPRPRVAIEVALCPIHD